MDQQTKQILIYKILLTLFLTVFGLLHINGQGLDARSNYNTENNKGSINYIGIANCHQALLDTSINLLNICRTQPVRTLQLHEPSPFKSLRNLTYPNKGLQQAIFTNDRICT